MKFKASYGEQGNDNIGNFLYTDTYTITDSNGSISLVPSSTKGNETITWETNANFNTGFEFSLFNGKLSGSAEFFYRRTTDMLAAFYLPNSSGYSGYYDNIGNMRNMGFEFVLNATPIRTKDLQWDINLNLTTYKNKITYIADANKTNRIDNVYGYSSGNQYYGEGQPLYTWYLIKYAGVNEEGQALYWQDIYLQDEKGNNVLDEKGFPIVTGQKTTTNAANATHHLCGTALPDVYGGFGTSFRWKDFDLSVDFTYQIGGKVYDSGYNNSMSALRGSQIHVDALKAWTSDNTSSNIPLFEYNNINMATASDRFLTNASYLCLQNVNIGYNLPVNICKKIGLGGVRIYATGNNLWLWSKRQGLDPRQSISGGTSNERYSPIRSISGGITLTF